MTLLSLSRHVQRCEECAKRQADIMNHAQIPLPDHLENHEK